ncbi:hypothetical protein ACS0TY_012370 [Phlomoides rotata]
MVDLLMDASFLKIWKLNKCLRPDVQMYTMVVGSLCQEGSVEEAKLEKMENSGCALDGCLYNVIIKSLLKRIYRTNVQQKYCTLVLQTAHETGEQ